MGSNLAAISTVLVAKVTAAAKFVTGAVISTGLASGILVGGAALIGAGLAYGGYKIFMSHKLEKERAEALQREKERQEAEQRHKKEQERREAEETRIKEEFKKALAQIDECKNLTDSVKRVKELIDKKHQLIDRQQQLFEELTAQMRAQREEYITCQITNLQKTSQLQSAIEEYEKDKAEYIKAGFEFLNGSELKTVLQTQSQVKTQVIKAIQEMDQIRAKSGTGLDDFTRKLREMYKVRAYSTETSTSDQAAVIEDFRKDLIIYEGYRPLGEPVPEAGTPLRTRCACGINHSGSWYHTSSNQLDTYNGNLNWEVVADGTGKWKCKSCSGLHDLKNFVFACASHKGSHMSRV